MNALLVLAAFSALAEWTFIARGHRRPEYLAKPAALSFLMLWFWRSAPSPLPFAGWAMLVGLALSLVGDVVLLMPQDPFLAGLSSFLLAHLAFIAAFNAGGPVWSPSTLALAAPLAIIVAAALRGLRRGLVARGRASLFPAVAIYSAVLGTMVWSAAATHWRSDWPPHAAILACLGGILFLISDLCLAWTKYVRPVPGQRLTVMVTYHLAQFALSYGMLLTMMASAPPA
jgi:uncharacterized membrane protein YhhN